MRFTVPMNDRKLSVLKLLVRGEASAPAIATALNLTVPAAGMALLRLSRNGLVARMRDTEQRCHFYSLTPKGAARLRVLDEND